MRHILFIAALALPQAGLAASGERIQVTGEVIDTWCYFSGVMGPTDAVVGSAHHTCALWCSAGGIPVGLLTEEGTVYMVLKMEADPASAGGDTNLHIASHTITADGMAYERDGLNYLIVETITADQDIVEQTHDDFGVIPGFAIPEEAAQ
ncbi:hypothetical protein JANAI62_08560 [Jannaschia pagri]|uniref:Uncharacterized protein n=1 Tax=Jannaschia pagri TaxID=2829797 RepID=A0ABQ4NII1_9RHOB|nr:MULTISPECIES: hypothetical protein [unclassified Jannaschia]GIT89659.1 hypothetical protein JANAI61_01170 [Jannaschia sp. AI_61]GIT94233.1 hypothetical protein JANAI62_08560 [Jannaschia sp. AI_62]